MKKQGRQGRDVPGNTVASQAMFDGWVHDVGKGWLDLLRACEAEAKAGRLITRITIRGVVTQGAGLLVILAASGDDGATVAFHNVDEVSTMWRGLANRMRNGSLKWRPDEYAGSAGKEGGS